MIASLPTLTTFALYLSAILTVGYLGYRATTSLSDFILGGRKLGSVVTALAAGASDMSGWLLMGLPGAIYLSGISGAWIAIGLIIGAWCNWHFVAARLRLYTEKYGNAQTLPEYLTHRFDDKKNILRIVSSIFILTFFTLYCSAGMVAGALLFESIFGIPYSVAIWIGALVTISYVFIGGFLAVSWTDTIQATLVITALIVTPLMIIYANNGLTTSLHTIQLAHSGHSNFFYNMSIIQIVSLLAWGLGYFGQPHILVRFMASRSVKNIPSARRIGMTWMILCLAGAIAVGFFGVAYFAGNPSIAGPVNANPETVFIEIAINLFNPWITGLLLAAILSVIMSALSAQLLICSSALTEDIYKTFLRKNASQTELIRFGRSMVVVIALIAILLGINPNSGVLQIVSYAWAGFGAAFGPVILFSLFWKRMTRNGALAGIITGGLTVLIWKQFDWLHLYEIVPGFILASLSIFTVSLLDSSPAERTSMRFNEIKNDLQKALA